MRQISLVQAGQPTYELYSLGWKAFQQLCVSVTSEIWGQTVQGFFDSHDGGRDGAFYGEWRPTQSEAFRGSFTAQCKFFAQAHTVLRSSHLKDELAKATRLARRGLADNYILFTNARLTGATDEKLSATFEAVPGIKRFAAFGSDRICQFIRESPRLRMLVPRVYGLGDLGQILDQRGYAQASEILSSLGDDFAKFVITDAYRNSAKALVEHGFVMLLGEPACGKSAIAAALALGALDEWGCSTLKIRDADDFVAHSNPHEPKQFFWIDDAFGSTQLDWQMAAGWNRAFPHIRAAIRRGARFVFTSRDYIYRGARSCLKESALPAIQESQVVIRVEELTRPEREQILYNHIRLGTQPKNYKRKLIPYLPQIAAHGRFSPEIARRLGNPAFTKNLHVSEAGLNHFVEHPIELLEEIVRTLDAGSRAAIALVFMRGGMLASPISLNSEEERAVVLLGAGLADIRSSIAAHEGSLLLLVRQGGRNWWRFKHPTILDAFAGLVAADPELMDIYLLGTPIERLLGEISCGEIVLPGVKVNVSADRYESLIPRVTKHAGNKWDNRSAVNRFLAHRCGRDFLVGFISRNPDFIQGLGMGSYLYAVSDVELVGRLYAFDLLPESERIRHAADIRELAVRTPDAGFLNPKIVGFLTSAEREEILAHARSQLFPRLDEEIDNWRYNYDGEEDPEDYFSHLRTALEDYDSALTADPEASALIQAGIQKLDDVVTELMAERPEPADWDREDYRIRSEAYSTHSSRSIFDDVDQ